MAVNLEEDRGSSDIGWEGSCDSVSWERKPTMRWWWEVEAEKTMRVELPTRKEIFVVRTVEN